MAPGNLVHVIDDDEAMRQSLDFLLKTVGFEVRTYEFRYGISLNARRTLHPDASSRTFRCRE